MKVRIIIQKDGNEIYRNFQFDDTDYYSHPWEITIPDMLDIMEKVKETREE